MIDEIRELFFRYSPWLVLVPTLLLARKKHRELRPLFWYFVASVVTQAASLVLWYNSINNLPLLHLYTLVEFVLLLWFFAGLMEKQLSRLTAGIIAACFLVFSVLDSLFIENIYKFNTLGRSIEALVFILLSLGWFLAALKRDSQPPAEGLYLPSVNYIVAGIFIYFSGSVVLFSFSNMLIQFTRSLALNIWSIHTVLLLVLYTLVTIALLKWRTN